METINVLSRMYGKADVAGFVATTQKALAPYDLRFVICTNVGDAVADVASKLSNVSVIFADMNRFDTPVNALLKVAAKNGVFSPNALFLSPGISITANHILAADAQIQTYDLFSFSWQVEGMLNDGSRPGRLGYNSAMLYNGHLLSNHTGNVPEHVNNGVLGELEIEWQGDVQHGPTGGGEETTQMASVLKHGDYNANQVLFGFDRTVIPSAAKTSTGNIGFDWKIARKVPMALKYLEMLGLTEADLMAHIKIYS